MRLNVIKDIEEHEARLDATDPQEWDRESAVFETFAELIISDLAETDSPTNLFANSLAAREVLSPAPIFYWPRFGGIFIE